MLMRVPKNFEIALIENTMNTKTTGKRVSAYSSTQAATGFAATYADSTTVT
jgi:hypothetical protein